MKKSDFNKFILVILLFAAFLPLFTPRLSSTKNKSIGLVRISSEFQWNETVNNNGLDEGISIGLDNNEDLLVTGRFYNSTKLTHDLFI